MDPFSNEIYWLGILDIMEPWANTMYSKLMLDIEYDVWNKNYYYH